MAGRRRRRSAFDWAEIAIPLIEFEPSEPTGELGAKEAQSANAANIRLSVRSRRECLVTTKAAVNRRNVE